jgi:hypothetical protein
VRCASTGAERREGGLCADPAYVVIPQAKKQKGTKKTIPKKQPTDFLLLFFFFF